MGKKLCSGMLCSHVVSTLANTKGICLLVVVLSVAQINTEKEGKLNSTTSY